MQETQWYSFFDWGGPFNSRERPGLPQLTHQAQLGCNHFLDLQLPSLSGVNEIDSSGKSPSSGPVASVGGLCTEATPPGLVTFEAGDEEVLGALKREVSRTW